MFAVCLRVDTRQNATFAVCLGLAHGEERGSPCVWCLPCVFLQTHDKSFLCCVPDKMHTVKILAHGELAFSGSDCKCCIGPY